MDHRIIINSGVTVLIEHLYIKKTIKLVLTSILLVASIALTGCIDLAANDGRNKHLVPGAKNRPKGAVYTMRGGLGGIFSKGMNHLEDTLENDYQVHSSSTVWNKAYSLSQSIIQQYKTKQIQGPIILAGHSLGANEQIKVAKNLAAAGVPVALLVTVDAVSPVRVPPNVKLAVNIYKPSFVPMFSGITLKAVDPTRTRIKNYNVDEIKEVQVNHFTIDKDEHVQKIMLDNILATLKSH